MFKKTSLSEKQLDDFYNRFLAKEKKNKVNYDTNRIAEKVQLVYSGKLGPGKELASYYYSKGDYVNALCYYNCEVYNEEKSYMKVFGEDTHMLEVDWIKHGVAALCVSVTCQNSEHYIQCVELGNSNLISKILENKTQRFIECKDKIFEIIKNMPQDNNPWDLPNKILAAAVKDENTIAGKLLRGKTFINNVSGVVSRTCNFFGQSKSTDNRLEAITQLLHEREVVWLKKIFLLKEMVSNYDLFPKEMIKTIIIIMMALLPDQKVENEALRLTPKSM